MHGPSHLRGCVGLRPDPRFFVSLACVNVFPPEDAVTCGNVIDAAGVGWWCGRMAGMGVFVGREGELSRLESALAERARLVLVVGDAGIGKTRFVAEGLDRASAGRLLAVGGGCLPLAVKPPPLPVADALAGLSRLDAGGPFEAAGGGRR